MSEDRNDAQPASGDGIDEAKRQSIDDAIARLPHLLRHIFFSHRLDGRSYEDIAEELGVTVEDVIRLMAKALTNIRLNLDHPWRCWWRRRRR
jgi:RNA polymerase sigma factor (sigma-70 family)